MQTPRIRELVGNALGRAWAPLVARISRARHARMFHPDGLTFVASVVPVPSEEFGDLGERFAGRALVRTSAALWRGARERPGVLGVAIRFRKRDTDPDSLTTVQDGDQDLLLATIRSPFTMVFSPLTTHVHDFLANRFWAVSPFDVAGLGALKFRLSPASAPVEEGDSRDARLRAAVAASDADWRLEVRRTFTVTWTTVAIVSLEREVAVDQRALRFSPFHDGLGIVPRGLVHAIRRAAYPASQHAR
jgi:hypothetical protein